MGDPNDIRMDEVWYHAPDWATTNPLALALWGIAGGVVLAFVLMRLHRWSRARRSDEIVHPGEISADVINMSHLQVVGAGGLGLVIMCAMVAIVIPPVGLSLGAGCLCGTIVAIVLIRRRGKAGPISSSSQHPGANTTLMIDEADETPRP
jgi:hypothetical protein